MRFEVPGQYFCLEPTQHIMRFFWNDNYFIFQLLLHVQAKQSCLDPNREIVTKMPGLQKTFLEPLPFFEDREVTTFRKKYF